MSGLWLTQRPNGPACSGCVSVDTPGRPRSRSGGAGCCGKSCASGGSGCEDNNECGCDTARAGGLVFKRRKAKLPRKCRDLSHTRESVACECDCGKCAVYTSVVCVEIAIFPTGKSLKQIYLYIYVFKKCSEFRTSATLASRATTLSRMKATSSPKVNCYRQTSRQVSLGCVDLCAVLQIVGIVALDAVQRVVRRECWNLKHVQQRLLPSLHREIQVGLL